MKNYILLQNIKFYAYHGVLEQETKVGNNFVLNIKVELDFMESCKTDNLDDTVSYADLYEVIKEEMEMPSKLLEHVAYRIVSRLRSQFGKLKTIDLQLAKQRPPVGIGADVEYATIQLIDTKE